MRSLPQAYVLQESCRYWLLEPSGIHKLAEEFNNGLTGLDCIDNMFSSKFII